MTPTAIRTKGDPHLSDVQSELDRVKELLRETLSVVREQERTIQEQAQEIRRLRDPK